jgi:carbon monoxide dehydrogenase subunit G
MQLHLEGTEILNLPRERVFQLLTDPGFLAKSLPDAHDAKVMEDNSVEARMKIGISFLTTSMATKMKLSDVAPTHHARLVVEGAGSGSSMKITSDFNLEGENPTRMKWVADAEISGVMAGIGSSIIKGFAEKKVKEIFQDIKKSMEQPAV